MQNLNNDELVHWRVSNLDTRGTFDIISLCLSTLFICVWNAVHVEVPRSRSFRDVYSPRFTSFLLGIFMPEFLLFLALNQFVEAQKISVLARKYLPASGAVRPPWWRRCLLRNNRTSKSRDRSNDVESSSSITSESGVSESLTSGNHDTSSDRTSSPLATRKNPWTMAHSFYALMGGFSNWDSDDDSESHRANLETWYQRSLVIQCVMKEQPQAIPDISVSIIRDRSKAGPLSKALLCAQMLFFCVNSMVRIIQGLPLSLLEITTIAHSICALGAYALWWYKPQDVGLGGRTPLARTGQEPPLSTVAGHTDAPGMSTILQGIAATILLNALYGCPHLLGLHVRFPTTAEHTLWVISTYLVLACPILGALAAGVTLLIRLEQRSAKLFAGFVTLSVSILALVYIFSSGFLLVENIRQVFNLPAESFLQPQWTVYFPHFS